jgi:hypothetical protein
VRSFLAGALAGAVAGAAATYLALEKPWKSDSTEVAMVGQDAGPAQDGKKRGKKKRRRKKRRKGGQEIVEVDETIELSAADRKILWKGPAVSLPPKSMDFGSGGDARSLDQTEINAGVSRGQSAMVKCIADSRGAAPLSATITLKMLVDGNGKISKYRVQAPAYLFKNGLYDCAGRAARSMRFPGTGSATVVTVPFELT